jgi:hypothetical protein
MKNGNYSNIRKGRVMVLMVVVSKICPGQENEDGQIKL